MQRFRLIVAAFAPVALILAAAFPARGQETEPSSRDERAWRKLDRVVARAMEESGTPGLAVAWLRDGRIFLTRGYGVLKAGSPEPVTPESIFEAASLGKPVFASLVVQLAVGGKISLDRPLADSLEDPFRQKIPTMMSDLRTAEATDPRLSKITPRMILSHSSGLPNWGRGRPLKLGFDPGSTFGYSGEGYVMLEALVEKAAGAELVDAVGESVFEPLGMLDSSYTWEDRFTSRLAWGHDGEGRPENRRRMKVPMSAASLYSTVEDYGRFLVSMMATQKQKAPMRRKAGKPGSRMGPVPLQMMQPANLMENNLSWGLGWGLETLGEEGTWFWHWGDNEHYKHFTMGSPSRREAVVIFTNGYNGLRDCRKVVEHLFGKNHPALDFPLLNY